MPGMRQTVLTIAMLATLMGTAACSDRPAEEDLQDRIAELEGENGQLRQQLQEAQAKATAASDRISEAGAGAAYAPQQAPRPVPQDREDAVSDDEDVGDAADAAANRAAQAAEDARAAAGELE